MVAANLIRQARKQRGVTQAELARRLRTTQSAVARLESQKTEPRFDTVLSAVRACGLDLHFYLAEPDLDHRRLIDDALALSPMQRLDELMVRREVEEMLRRARRLT